MTDLSVPIPLYVETNLLLSYATGRDLATVRLIAALPRSVRLIMPACCLMEAFSVLESEGTRRRKFATGLAAETRQIQANLVAPLARSLADRLDVARVDFQELSAEFDARLRGVVGLLAGSAELIPTSPEVVRSALSRPFVEDPTDNLILASILAHAGGDPGPHGAFQSENSRCFGGNREATSVLAAAGIKYFADAAKCLEWCGSLPES